MPFTMRQLLAEPWLRRAALVLAVGVLLGFAGPFGSYPPLSRPVRYAFWIGMVIVGYAAALAADKLVSETGTPRSGLRLLAVAIASAVPLTFVAAWVIPLVRPGHTYQPLQLPTLFSAVAAVQLAVTFILLRTPGAPLPVPPARGTERSGALPPALRSRLPNRSGEDIVALEAEDHYLRVHTASGSDLVLMRLSDAIAALDPGLGFQVHRSWWVADDAISETVRSSQRLHLKLSNGLLVPVGRTYSAAVRERSARFPNAGNGR